MGLFTKIQNNMTGSYFIKTNGKQWTLLIPEVLFRMVMFIVCLLYVYCSIMCTDKCMIVVFISKSTIVNHYIVPVMIISLVWRYGPNNNLFGLSSDHIHTAINNINPEFPIMERWSHIYKRIARVAAAACFQDLESRR